MSPVLIGVDVGASKTVVMVEGPEGHSARSEATGAALKPGRILRSANTVAEAVRGALRGSGTPRADVLVVGAAGAGRKEEREEFSRALRAEEFAGTVRVTTDGEIALLAAFGSEPGVLVAAGTGSIGMARAPDGQVYTAGGYGWQMGDEGSGYAMGRAALGAVGRAHDGRGEPTALTRAVFTATRCGSVARLVRWAGAAGPGEIAGLARSVARAADDGDATAMAIVEDAANAIVGLADSLVKRFPDGEEVPVALTGGLWHEQSPLRPAVLRRLDDHQSLAFIDRQVDPAEGAILLAREIAADPTP